MNAHGADFEDQWGARCDAIQARVVSAVGSDAVVKFSAYEEDANGLPIDNLDKVLVKGPGRLVLKGDQAKAIYRSMVVSNPTWLIATTFANEAIKASGNFDKKYLEDAEMVGVENGVTIFELIMGS